METTTIQCGACGQVIAVSKEHLGQQVQCPLCGAVIEAPAPAPHPVPLVPSNISDEDSIFAPPEEEEDIFGRQDERPLVQMPNEPAPPRQPKTAFEDERTEAMPGEDRYRPSVNRGSEAATLSEPGHVPADDEGTQAQLAGFGVRRPTRRSNFGALVMIFLIPYSIVITFAVIFLFYERTQRIGLDLLPDHEREDGAPRRVKHDLALPAKLRTQLGVAIAIGDLLVTPLRIERTADNDLVLKMKMENTSTDTAFNPFPDSFHRYMTKQTKPVPPYTFLDTGNPETRLYGGYTARYRQPFDKRTDENDDGTFNGVIGPNETVYTELITSDKDRYLVPRLLAGNKELLWRVHVRRGFVRVGNRDVSTTAVIGVEFPTSAVAGQRG